MLDGDGLPRRRAVRLLHQPGDAVGLPPSHDAIVSGKIAPGSRNTPPCDVVRRSDYPHLLDADLSRDEVGRILKIADTHGEVDIFADQVDPPVGEADIEVQRRI